MKAVELVHTRIIYSEVAFAELVLWELTTPLRGSSHRFKYRLAYVVHGECVLRYDNEAGKGDHRHARGKEYKYSFHSLENLLSEFRGEIRRLTDEDRDT